MADYAWERMHQWSMPAIIALDMVQDIVGERQQAFDELLLAAGRDVKASRPAKETQTTRIDSDYICARMLIRQWSKAELRRLNLNFHVRGWWGKNGGKLDWLDWTHYVRRAIALLRELETALTPSEMSS